MTVQLLLAPAAAGKTAHVVNLVREAAQNLRATPRVVLPTHLQVRALRRRLAAAGGAIGVRLLTFDRLYAECLNAAGEAYTELSEPVQYRLIRSLVDDLHYYAPLAGRPGFIQSLQALINELKAARIHPEAFARAVQKLGGHPRLSELAQVYAAYQQQLQAHGWADRAGMGWLAVEALEQRAPHVGRDWPLLVVDGFDNFTPIQVALLQALAGRVGQMVITLTGTVGNEARPVHRRFARTRHNLEEALGVQPQPLPPQRVRCHPRLARLEERLYRIGQVQEEEPAPPAADAAVELVEAPDRAAEVRAALRWLKARLVQDGMAMPEVALLARNIAPYRPFLMQTAAEFGVPVRVVDGLPLRSNPAVAALLDLLALMLPAAEGEAEPGLPWRRVVEAWRSPYFDWSAQPAEDADEPIGIAPGDADTLDAVARWGRVIGGQSQWDEVFEHLASLSAEPEAAERERDEEQGLPAGIPLGEAAQALRSKFDRFVKRLTPPAGPQAYRTFVQWLEDLIGSDPELEPNRFPETEAPTSLRIVARARAGPVAAAERDVAALHTLKDVLRGIVWAEEAVQGTQAVDYPRFLAELAGAVEAATYPLPIAPEREELLVADVVRARGLAFRAVAVLGLAEGEFPATLNEDPFLRDADRAAMRELGLPLEPSTESAELEFFYETVTRPCERLLLTRPRLADTGALWQPSPYWEEVRRLTGARPRTLTSEALLPPAEVASWPELMESLAAHPDAEAARKWVQQDAPQRYAALEQAAHVLRCRSARKASEVDGDLSALAPAFARQFGPDYVWSPTRLETYRSCPFHFYVDRVLGLEPRPEPTEGLDARQLGTIYHRILEGVYRALAPEERNDLPRLLDVLPGVAAAVLDAAPREEGFRESAWWEQTRAEITQKVRRSLQELARLPPGFVPWGLEMAFGMGSQAPLAVRAGDDRLQVHGVIDRVDRAPNGHLRVIDYKTAGPSAFKNQAVADGEKLQLPLYALAARDALRLGEPVEGFYWHVQHAEASPFTLDKFPGGPQAAMDAAVAKAWEAVHGVRQGQFVPEPPHGDCPPHCPAVAFCWHFRPQHRD